jgi:hypothetical protein
MDLDEFIKQELETSGKKLYTFDDVCRLTERWIKAKQEAAAAFEGWKSDPEIDALLGIVPQEQER